MIIVTEAVINILYELNHIERSAHQTHPYEHIENESDK